MPSMTSGLVAGAMRVFDLSLGQMLWARRTIFMALLSAAPVLIAAGAQIAAATGAAAFRFNGVRADGADVFGLMIWIFYVRFIVPVLGVFYGTALIADEVEDKTITYLFVRPVRRGAVLLGKYLAYLVCTTAVVLPSVVLVYFLLVPLADIASGAAGLARDIGILALGLAAYGALFALAGSMLRRPLVAGLVFLFGWEQIALLMPGYLKQLTVAYYLQGLVPHAVPGVGAGSLTQSFVREVLPPAVSVLWLSIITISALTLGVRAVERREYVLEQ